MAPGHFQFIADQNQTGSQIGLVGAGLDDDVENDGSNGIDTRTARLSPRCRVILMNGDAHSEVAFDLNPSFTDWMTDWPTGWTDGRQAATGLFQWLQPARGAISKDS
jgi:hypothetical protein